MNKTQIRDLAINLLDDEHGINSDAYETLKNADKNLDCNDIFAAVVGVNGRYFLNEEHGLIA
jgi:hypothetical protein